MKIRMFLAVTAAALTLAQAASAAVVGSLGVTRTQSTTHPTTGVVTQHAFTGTQFSTLRGHMASKGATFAEGAETVTAEYLSGVDVFVTGSLWSDSNAAGRASATEVAALQDWVRAGGVALLLGEMNAYTDNANSWLGAFGLSISGSHNGPSTWIESDNPLVDGIFTGGIANASTNLGGAFAPGDYDVLATYNAKGNPTALVGLGYGLGYVIGSGDASLFTDARFSTGSRTAIFASNMVGLADAAAIPIPATLPLLLGGVATLGFLRRRKAA